MVAYFEEYWKTLVKDIPANMISIGILVLIIGFFVLLINKGIRDRKGIWASMALLTLVEYVMMLLGLTTFLRTIPTKFGGYDFRPFWSYSAFFSGENPELLAENILNVVIFVPVGLLMGISFRGVKWWMVIIAGSGISVFIETFQFISKKGFSELDDVMHNTLGCIIGYGLFVMTKRLLRYE